jgi:tetratricopeptide (TPR) repeat protein
VAPTEDYSRADVRRKFGLSEPKLKSWERQNLIAPAASYTFSDLLTIKTLIRLRENKIPVREIARALDSLRDKLREVKQPLAELRVVLDGKRITVHVAGQKMEAVSGQILFDFDAAEIGAVARFPERRRNHALRVRESEAWFQKGLELEETGAPVEDAVDAYSKVLELNPGAAGALVNLGTIYYRLRKFIEAETEYALAEFNLGNLYDEQGRMDEAFEHYRRALALNPQYADAHFNLALLCERLGDQLKAVHHWKTYLKLDHSGQWAEIARRQLERLRQAVIR